jgi:hypothetical protein
MFPGAAYAAPDALSIGHAVTELAAPATSNSMDSSAHCAASSASDGSHILQRPWSPRGQNAPAGALLGLSAIISRGESDSAPERPTDEPLSPLGNRRICGPWGGRTGSQPSVRHCHGNSLARWQGRAVGLRRAATVAALQAPPLPGELSSHAVWRYYRFRLSYRDVEELLAARGIAVRYETIRRWCPKFGPTFADGVRRRRARPGDKWHLDEVQVKSNGRKPWRWRAVD